MTDPRLNIDEVRGIWPTVRLALVPPIITGGLFEITHVDVEWRGQGDQLNVILMGYQLTQRRHRRANQHTPTYYTGPHSSPQLTEIKDQALLLGRGVMLGELHRVMKEISQ